MRFFARVMRKRKMRGAICLVSSVLIRFVVDHKAAAESYVANTRRFYWAYCMLNQQCEPSLLLCYVSASFLCRHKRVQPPVLMNWREQVIFLVMVILPRRLPFCKSWQPLSHLSRARNTS